MRALVAAMLLFQAAPEYVVRPLEGPPVKLKELRGSPVIVQFFNPN
jgi:hypothetical protein